MTSIILPGNAACVVLLSMYLTTTSFIYLLQHYKGKLNKENFFVFVCSFLSFALSTLYFVLEFLSGEKEYTIKSKVLCALIPLAYQTSITICKVLSSLVFVYRYELINRRRLLSAPKISKIFTVVIVLFAVLHFAGQLLFVKTIRATSNLGECRYNKLFINANVSYSFFSGVCFL